MEKSLAIIVLTAIALISCNSNGGETDKPTFQGKVDTVKINSSKTYQTIAGFGGFGGQRTWWSGGPYSSPKFINTIVNDFGVTIIRDELPTNFEYKKGKFDIDSTTAHDHAPVGAHFLYLKALKKARVQKIIVSIWSPPAWMKANHRIDDGMDHRPPNMTQRQTAPITSCFQNIMMPLPKCVPATLKSSNRKPALRSMG
jgi:O-glycosyl hydrolase